MWDVAFHRLASRELGEALKYYSAIDPRIANRFRDAVNAATARIRQDPESLPREGTKFHRIRVGRRFPYVLVFETTAEQRRALIVAVAHTSRRPGYWRRRHG